MAISIREFETMVADTLSRIVNSGVGIDNTSTGSVVRMLVEAIMAENDIQWYELSEIYKNMNIDTATGEDLDNLVKIVGVVRNGATAATTTLTFSTTEASVSDIIIPYNQICSTQQDHNGVIYSFKTTEEATLVAGETSVTVPAVCTEAGSLFVPANTVVIMDSPIIGIDSVTNEEAVNGGSDAETDSELRERSRDALLSLGKSTVPALEGCVKAIPGVTDAIVVDMPGGVVGTASVTIVTNEIPTPESLKSEIHDVVDESKAAGVLVNIVYPDICWIQCDITIADESGTVHMTDTNKTNIGNAIIEYFKTLSIGDDVRMSQIMRYALNAIDSDSYYATVKINGSASDMVVDATEVASIDGITINGTVWKASEHSST